MNHLKTKKQLLSARAQQLINQCHQENKAMVLVTGVFDLLHQEHLNFLIKAKQAGDFLIVGVETDYRVKLLKGDDRPIDAEKIRMKKIKQTKIADYVFLLPEQFTQQQDHLKLLSLIKPKILAVSENTPKLQEKRQAMLQVGGVVKVVHKHNPAVSTTRLVNQTKKR